MCAFVAAPAVADKVGRRFDSDITRTAVTGRRAADMAQANLLLTHLRHALAHCFWINQPLGTVTEVIKHYFVAVSQLVEQLCSTHEMSIALFSNTHGLCFELCHRRRVRPPGTT